MFSKTQEDFEKSFRKITEFKLFFGRLCSLRKEQKREVKNQEISLFLWGETFPIFL